MEEPTNIITEEEQPGSLLDQLAARRKEISETRETLIPVTGYDKEPPLLLVKYRLLEGPDMERIAKRVRKERQSGAWDRQINAVVDMMVSACVGIFVDVAADGHPVPLSVDGEEVLGFNTALAKGLSFTEELPDPPTARQVVFGLFANNDIAIADHGARLNRWFTNTTSDVSSEFLGNL